MPAKIENFLVADDGKAVNFGNCFGANSALLQAKSRNFIKTTVRDTLFW